MHFSVCVYILLASLLSIAQLAFGQGADGCNIPPAIITNFTWHNSTHNCGCDDGGCLPTGLHGGPGCGPPDMVEATFSQQSPTYNDTLTCGASDPGSVPARPIPGGLFNCRSLGRHFIFTANGTEGTLTYVEPNFICPEGRAQVTYVGSFEMDCVYDRFRNSTCVQSEPSFQLEPDEVVGIH
ncbi:hypothetical protein P875_00053080 [Aspergillus parasiticus SU-1]|uniref:Uncharacterized protein n=1 Tax=Aspergillus parasiticus (strain ATCC 56775 / NRRL 5862 / SRRC 143 / SU-1) TaxID=1403190 RepID=A0A0F0HYW6_ASPPU|nr:hypothetical protein P875_00053080 [Aspergillus parasiticus SU-1]